MKLSWRVFPFGGLLCLLIPAAVLCAQEKVTGLKVFWREGQTFVTWKELGDVEKEKYRIYVWNRKISSHHLRHAKHIATIAEGSCHNFQVLRKRKKLDPKAIAPVVDGYAPRYAIQDNVDNESSKLLPFGTGLFVRTIKKPAKSYYAVVPEVKGKVQTDKIAVTPKPVDEKVMLPGAVIQWKHSSGKAAVYTHWMDYETWDPFCESYAYSFGLAVPEKYNGKFPLGINYYGHGMGQGYKAGSKAPYFPAVWMWHGDESGSWWFGVMNKKKDKVINYAEQRIRWSYKWVQAGRKNQFFKVDPRWVIGHGHSMGGTMMNAFALRMGDIFGCCISSAGATIHRRNETWVNQASRLWGTIEKNMPTMDGTGVWDHQDYAQWSLKNIKKETAFLTISNGKKDGSVKFEPFPDFIDALQKSKRPFSARWDQRGHSWSPMGTRNARWNLFQIPNNETIPAFANASNSDDPKKTSKGQVNGKLEWSCSGNDFDKAAKVDDLLDTEKEWAMNIRSLSGPTTVDVTPRKVQKFKIHAGKEYAWENISFANPKSARSAGKGKVKADEHGLITVEKFQCDKQGLGNRLIIKPVK